MTPVLVVAAMRSELRAFTKRRPGGDGAGRAVATGVLGIGTHAARSAARRLVEVHDPSHVLVIGVAGGIGPSTSIGSLVVPEAVLDAATGTSYVPAPVPGHPAAGLLHTSDELVVDRDRVAALVAEGVVALDMESAAVAQVCEVAGVPWSVLRGISDHADAEAVDPATLGLVGPEGQPRPAAVLRYVLRHPRRVPHLTRLAKGLAAATSVSAEAAVGALARLG